LFSMCNADTAQHSAVGCAPEPQNGLADTDAKRATARSLVTASVEEAFDLGVADVLFIL
jgi:hypothetical protein